MAKTFSADTTEAPSALVAKAERVVVENGADFRGDEKSGWFSGSGIEGTYRIESGTVTITVTEKPWFLPWSVVESQVKSFFE